MPEGFPYGVYSRYGTGDTQENYSGSKLDGKVNRICKNIANTVIRSSRRADDEDDDAEDAVMTFSLPKIPKDVLIFGSIVVFKILLYVAYKAASTHHMEILDI